MPMPKMPLSLSATGSLVPFTLTLVIIFLSSSQTKSRLLTQHEQDLYQNQKQLHHPHHHQHQHQHKTKPPIYESQHGDRDGTEGGNNNADSSEMKFEQLYRVVRYQPRHIHLAYGDEPTEMVVTWSTIDDPNGSFVEFGVRSVAEKRVNGSRTLFIEKGVLKIKQYIHRVLLTNLEPGQFYVYHCGTDRGWSELFFFTAMRNGTDWSPNLAVYGDLGADNAQSLTQLQSEVQNGLYDSILHVGDFAYNMETNDGLVGDVFMEDIEPMAAYLPYMTTAGNHESANNFTQYKNRFSMPGPFESMFYSWNMGPIHFISIASEFYYYLQFGMKQVANQYQWLQDDLAEANKPANRKKRPWIIVYGHRPMYCTNENHECMNNESKLRIGIPLLHMFGLEDLLIDNGVDLAIWAHEHSYERLFPLYNRTVYNGTLEEPYRNPKGLTHIITGSAGCAAEHDPFPSDMPPWSAFRTVDYGYSRMKVINLTHLHYEQVSIDKGGKVVDSFYLIRDEHKPYGPFPASNSSEPEGTKLHQVLHQA